MKNMKFSIGYNYDIGMIPLLEIFRDHIAEFYFPIPQKFVGSGRSIKEPDGYESEVSEIIKKCTELGISSNLLLNSSCEGENVGNEEYMKRIVDYILSLADTGLNCVTVTNPIIVHLIVENIKSKYPNFKIHSSVNCYVKNVEHAIYLKDIGVDVITIDRDINRNLSLIKEIKENVQGCEIKILLNEGCLANCPFRKSHFNMIAHGNDSKYFDCNSCITLIKKQPESFFRVPFVRPEDVNNYVNTLGEGVHYKLATRDMHTLKMPFVIEAYISENYEGDLLSLLSTLSLFDYFNKIDNKVLTDEGFFEKITTCNYIKNLSCGDCDYCKELLKKAADVNDDYNK